jgi:hypothetical protein
MSVSISPKFIADLQSENDANFARRVLTKLFNGEGAFRHDTNDHRYKGIADAWIRYVSQGKSAFRVIYVKTGDEVLLYRCGPHSIEDHLVAPAAADVVINVDAREIVEVLVAPAPKQPLANGGRIISNLRTPALWHLVLGRRLIPHKEIILVSPFLSHSLLWRTARLGRLLDDWVEDGTKVSLITRPPSNDDHKLFEDLEARGIPTLFHERLHSKLYMFQVDQTRVKYDRKQEDLLVLGSANLTESGFGATRERGNDELSYELPSSNIGDLETYVAYLATNAADLVHLRMQVAKLKKRIR